jgi:hypothetical protein
MVTSLALSVLQPRSRSGLENLPAAPAPPTAPAPSTTGNPESAVPGSSAPSSLEPAPPADGAAKPESSAPAAGDKAGVDRPLTQKDVGPGAK